MYVAVVLSDILSVTFCYTSDSDLQCHDTPNTIGVSVGMKHQERNKQCNVVLMRCAS